MPFWSGVKDVIKKTFPILVRACGRTPGAALDPPRGVSDPEGDHHRQLGRQGGGEHGAVEAEGRPARIAPRLRGCDQVSFKRSSIDCICFFL